MIVLITPEHTITNEINIITELFYVGLKKLHVRKPHYTEKEIEAYLRRIPPLYHPYIHLHHHIAMAQGMQVGIHVSYKDIGKISSSFIPSSISCSTHQVNEFRVVDGKCNYAFISPLFNSISKEGYLGDMSLLSSGHIKRKSLLIALGGITQQHIPVVKQYQFDGIALLGAIWNQPNPLQSFLSMQEEWAK